MTLAATLPSPKASWGIDTPSLLPTVRQALSGAAGHAALLVPSLDPARRRAARLLLHEAARAGGGVALDVAAEDGAGAMLLLGCQHAAVGRLVFALRALGLPEGQRWDLEQDADALLAWAGGARPAPRPDPRPDPAQAASLEAGPATVALADVVLWRTVLRLGPDVAPRRLAWRGVVSRRRLAAALGPPFPGEPDLLADAAARVEGRLATAPPPAEAGKAALPLMLPLPDGMTVPAPELDAVALLPLSELAQPPGLAARAAALRAAGWGGIALDGLDAALLPLIDPNGLPSDLPLLLRWSPPLAERAGMAALRGRLDAARVVLTSCDAPEALGWGLEVGIRSFAGPAVEALLAAARRQGPTA